MGEETKAITAGAGTWFTSLRNLNQARYFGDVVQGGCEEDRSGQILDTAWSGEAAELTNELDVNCDR